MQIQDYPKSRSVDPILYDGLEARCFTKSYLVAVAASLIHAKLLVTISGQSSEKETEKSRLRSPWICTATFPWRCT